MATVAAKVISITMAELRPRIYLNKIKNRLRQRQFSRRVKATPDAKTFTDYLTEAFGLTRYLDTTSGTLPAGYKQRLALSCAIMHEPPVLFLDEPTSGVDPLTRREFWAHINALVAGGVTVMVTTHFLDEAEYCDRIALIYRGRVIATGYPDDLKGSVRTSERPDPTLEDAFIALVETDDKKVAA